MNFTKDLIIVHAQEFFFIEAPTLKSTIKNELQSLVNKAMRSADIHISFWEDISIPKAGSGSIIAIPNLKDKVSRIEADGGICSLIDYIIKGPEVILTGGWLGACINNAIISIMRAFFANPEVVKTGSLDIRLPVKAVYEKSELLADMTETDIKNNIVSAMDQAREVLLIESAEVRERGLRITILKAGEAPFFEKVIVDREQEGDKLQFQIAFILVP